jgi:hypothetical protein
MSRVFDPTVIVWTTDTHPNASNAYHLICPAASRNDRRGIILEQRKGPPPTPHLTFHYVAIRCPLRLFPCFTNQRMPSLPISLISKFTTSDSKKCDYDDDFKLVEDRLRVAQHFESHKWITIFTRYRTRPNSQIKYTLSLVPWPIFVSLSFDSQHNAFSLLIQLVPYRCLPLLVVSTKLKIVADWEHFYLPTQDRILALSIYTGIIIYTPHCLCSANNKHKEPAEHRFAFASSAISLLQINSPPPNHSTCWTHFQITSAAPVRTTITNERWKVAFVIMEATDASGWITLDKVIVASIFQALETWRSAKLN